MTWLYNAHGAPGDRIEWTEFRGSPDGGVRCEGVIAERLEDGCYRVEIADRVSVVHYEKVERIWKQEK